MLVFFVSFFFLFFLQILAEISKHLIRMEKLGKFQKIYYVEFFRGNQSEANVYMLPEV